MQNHSSLQYPYYGMSQSLKTWSSHVQTYSHSQFPYNFMGSRWLHMGFTTRFFHCQMLARWEVYIRKCLMKGATYGYAVWTSPCCWSFPNTKTWGQVFSNLGSLMWTLKTKWNPHVLGGVHTWRILAWPSSGEIMFLIESRYELFLCLLLVFYVLIGLGHSGFFF